MPCAKTVSCAATYRTRKRRGESRNAVSTEGICINFNYRWEISEFNMICWLWQYERIQMRKKERLIDHMIIIWEFHSHMFSYDFLSLTHMQSYEEKFLTKNHTIMWGKNFFFSYEIILNHVRSYEITFDHIKSLVITWKKKQIIYE